MRKVTWAQAKQEINFEDLAGVCADSKEALRLVNKAQRILMNRGKWWGTYQRIRLCAPNRCITMPRHVAAIEAIAFCGNPAPIRTEWYEFVAYGDGVITVDDAIAKIGMMELRAKPAACTFNDIRGTNSVVRLYAMVPQDHGKKVLIQGYDKNRQWIRTYEDGRYIDGVRLTLASPFVDSEIVFSTVTGVQKPETEGNILLYEYDKDNDTQRALGVYEPDERTPWYRRWEIIGGSSPTDTVEAIVKLDFIPVAKDEDYLMIANIPALELMIQAVLKYEKNLIDDAVKYEMTAIREMNHELRTLGPAEHSVVNLKVFGSAKLAHKRIGSLC